MFQGLIPDLLKSPDSPTGQALRSRVGTRGVETPLQKAKASSHLSTKNFGPWLELDGLTTNNLKSVDVAFPLGRFTVVAGVSGAGKSSLVHSSLFPAVAEALTKRKSEFGPPERTWKSVKGAQYLRRLIEIDQIPAGKTSTSTPASYLGIFDELRKLYAMLPEAKSQGFASSHFSFNTGKGRCPTCQGKGFIKVPMSFLPDASAECEECNGLRYDESTLSIEYQGVSIGAMLLKTMDEARELLINHKKIRRTLDYVHKLGVGYLTLGQPTHTLSGGEVQRLKIARELGSADAHDTLYILDEPTVGLHMLDVDRLVSVLRELTERGNTVVVIEHNLDVIANADYLIELGPGPAERGGEVIFSGTPYELKKLKRDTPTKKYLLQPQPLVPGELISGQTLPTELVACS